MQRGADLAATFGGTTADAVEAINAAVSRGEFDPLEKYGVSLNMTAVNAELAARGQDKLTGSALKHAKAQVVLESVYKNTGKAAGQFAREQDTAAGSAAIASAQFEDASAALGQALLPAAAAVANALAGVAKWASKNVPLVTALAAAVGVLVSAILIYNVAMKIAAIVQTAFNVAMSANVIFLVIVAVIALVAVFILLYKKVGWFRAAVDKLWAGLKTAFMFVVNMYKAEWKIMVKVLTVTFKVVGRVISAVWNAIRGPAKKTWNAIKGAAVSTANVIRRVWNAVSSALSNVASHIRSAFTNTWQAVKAVASSITSAISHAFSGVRHAVTTAVSTVSTVFRSLPGKVRAAFSGAATLLLNVGHDIIAGLIRGITNAASGVASAVQKIIDAIPKFIRKRMGIGSPSKVMAALGRDIMAGLEKGMADGVEGVKRVTKMATDAITNTIKKASKTSKQARTLTRQALRSIEDESNALVKNARKRDKLYAGIAKQTGILKEQKNAWTQLKQSVADTSLAFGSFASAAGTTITDMLADMANRVDAVKQFQRVMAGLAKLRLNKTTLAELAQAGPEDALARAQALLSGGAGAVQRVNSLQTQLSQAANTLGNQTADAMYKTGIDATQALLDGMVADAAALEKTANKLARNLAAAVRKALKRYTPKGGGGNNASANAAVYGAPAVPLGRTATGAAAGGAGVHITINGALDPEAVARQVGRLLGGHDRRIGGRAA